MMLQERGKCFARQSSAEVLLMIYEFLYSKLVIIQINVATLKWSRMATLNVSIISYKMA